MYFDGFLCWTWGGYPDVLAPCPRQASEYPRAIYPARADRSCARLESNLRVDPVFGFSGGYIVFPGPFHIPAPETPTNVPNRCSLKPLTPETPQITLLLVCPPRRLTPQVVCRSRPRF